MSETYVSTANQILASTDLVLLLNLRLHLHRTSFSEADLAPSTSKTRRVVGRCVLQHYAIDHFRADTIVPQTRFSVVRVLPPT